MDPNAYKKNLVNKFNKEEAIKKLKKEKFSRLIVSFYLFKKIINPLNSRDALFTSLNDLNIKGRIYLSKDGINAQISIPEKAKNCFESFIKIFLKEDSLRFNYAINHNKFAFYKLTIKVKKILADGLDKVDMKNKGEHLQAVKWNKKAKSKKSFIIDMRNHYESEIGKFKNAHVPEADTFREEMKEIKDMLLNQKEKDILMYCTGGIRCEIASSYLKQNGFKKVYQLEGGIINYFNQIKSDSKIENLFIGKNFVFDDRLSEEITSDVISFCHQCGNKSDTHINCKNLSCNLLFIQCNECNKKNLGCCSPKCIDIVCLSEKEQQKIRKGITKNKIFHSHKKVNLQKEFKKD
tara:strand:- start:5189 stop:6238 length:1050 start_codon:yes stop_codon:yes gene_type:complete